MTAFQQKQRMTLEEFECLPVGPPYYEFEEGEVILLASPTFTHQDIASETEYALRTYLRLRQIGKVGREVDVYLPDGRVFVPDVVFLMSEHLNMINPTDGKIYGAPDLAIEVTSSDKARDRVHKLQIYHRNRIAWYWVIDRRRSDH